MLWYQGAQSKASKPYPLESIGVTTLLYYPESIALTQEAKGLIQINYPVGQCLFAELTIALNTYHSPHIWLSLGVIICNQPLDQSQLDRNGKSMSFNV